MPISLSDFWRTDKSDDRVSELVSVLRGAQTIIGMVGSDFAVRWNSKDDDSYFDSSRRLIALNPKPLENMPLPIDGRVVDVIIGFGLHEAGHSIWSGNLNYTTIRKHGVDNVVLFDKILRTLEENYIDQRMSSVSVARAEYIRVARSYCLPPNAEAQLKALAILDNPTCYDIIGIWAVVSEYGLSVPDDMSQKVKNALVYLLSRTQEYVKQYNFRKREKIAIEVYGYISKFPTGKTDVRDIALVKEDLILAEEEKPDIKSGKKLEDGFSGDDSDEDSDKSSDDTREDTEEDKPEEDGESSEETDEDSDEGPDDKPEKEGGEKSGDDTDDIIHRSITGGSEAGHLSDLESVWRQAQANKARIAAEENKLVSDELDSGQVQDFTKELYAEGIRVGVRITDAVFNENLYHKSRMRVRPEIEATARAFKMRDTSHERFLTGQYSGKLDSRRLSRVGCENYKVFKRREELSEGSLAVVFLMDCSASMSSYMDIVMDSAVIFAEAMRMRKNTYCEVLTYTGGSVAFMSRLSSSRTKRICLNNVRTGGGTPSAPAIMTAALSIQNRPEDNKLVIHFTDGCSNDDALVKTVIEKLLKRRIKTLTIAAGAFQEDSLRAIYGEDFSVISSVRELPAAIAALARKI